MPPRFASLRPPQWTALALVLLGSVVAASGGWFVLQWHNPETSSLGLERVQYDAAWAFVFGGAALAATAAGLSLVGRLCASVPIVLGALRVMASVAPGTIGFHPIMANPWLPLGAGNYNDMGLLSGVVFIVLGAGLASLRSTRYGPWRSVLVALLAAIALALAILLLLGAWFGGIVAAQWLQLAGGERSAALLFLLLGGGVLAHALLAGEAEQDAVRRWTPAIIGFAAFICALVLWRALGVQETRFVQNATQLVAADIRGRVEAALEQQVRTLQRLAVRSEIYGFTEAQFLQDASSLLGPGGTAPELEAVAWAGDDLVVRWVATRTRGDAGALHVDPAQPLGGESLLALRKPVITRFVDLASGGKGVAIAAPAYAGDSLRGIVIGALGADWLLGLLGDRYGDYQVELLAGGELASSVSGTGEPAGIEWSQQLPLAVANARWMLRVTPTQVLLQHSASALPEASLALGVVLAILLALCTYLFLTAQRRAGELAATNQRLLHDIKVRRQTEQALHESERHTRLIVDAIKDCAIFMLDTEGRIASWHNGARQLTGYTADEILGRHVSTLYPPDRKTPPESELEVAARQGWVEEECWHLRKDGTRYCGDDIISAIRDDHGELQGFSVVIRDATQRIELRQQTERARDYYFALFSDFPNLVWRSGATGACDYLNQTWLDYTGRTLDMELGRGWLEGVHPNDRQRWQEVFSSAEAAREPFELELRLRRANGEYGWLICSGRPYHDMKGGFSGFLCTCYDNTERRAAEDALRTSEERLERLTSNVPGMVFKLEREDGGRLKFQYVSPGGAPLTGLTKAAVLADAEAFFGRIAAADRAHLLATLEASARQLTNWNWSGRLSPLHETAEKWVTIRASPRRSDDRHTILDGVVLDDSQARLAQLELERSREELRALSRHLQSIREEEKARIAREVHDELGSTLTALKMDLDWLGEHLPGAPEAIAQKRVAMGKLVDAAVAATRRIVTDLRPSILDDLGLAAALRWQATEFGRHTGAAVHVDADQAAANMGRDTALTLFRIFQETLTNVARHAQATEVDVKLSSNDGAFVLQIHDNGIGIADADLTKPTSHGIRGMRERAKQLGGDISLLGQPGEGTTLVISVPRGEHPA